MSHVSVHTVLMHACMLFTYCTHFWNWAPRDTRKKHPARPYDECNEPCVPLSGTSALLQAPHSVLESGRDKASRGQQRKTKKNTKSRHCQASNVKDKRSATELKKTLYCAVKVQYNSFKLPARHTVDVMLCPEIVKKILFMVVTTKESISFQKWAGDTQKSTNTVHFLVTIPSPVPPKHSISEARTMC